MTFGQVLKLLREEKRLKQKEFAEKLGVSDSTYRGWEAEGKEPRYVVLCKIAKVLNVTVGQLLGVEEL